MIFKLVSYNIQRGIRLEELGKLFGGLTVFRDTDVIALQEVSFLPDRRNQLGWLADRLPGDWGWSYATVMRYPDKEYGNGFLYRTGLEVSAGMKIDLPSTTRMAWYEKAKTEGGVPDTKSAWVQEFTSSGRTVQVACVHLDFAGGWRHRRDQLAHLLGSLPEAPHHRRIICGDFNTVGAYRWPPARRNLQRSLAPATSAGWTDLTGAMPYSSDLFSSIDPADPVAGVLEFGKRVGCRFRMKTDHILARGSSRVIAAGAVDAPESDLFRISDHLPQTAIIDFS